MAMRPHNKLGTEVEIKSDGVDFLHMFGGKKVVHVPKLASHRVPKVDLHVGEWGDHGAIKVWTYVLDGKVETYKEKVTIDEENKTVHMTALEGDCLELYKSYNIIFQIIDKGEKNVVKITIEYEKKTEDVPPPLKYQEFLAHFVKDVDAKFFEA